ncbi:FtsX-like permease family protein [Roseateles cavernae]|uniref:FtsX-like permease family protein n=1 Tax=Roseateles cavernae TaxID=3153578 RepID=UPI0032E4C19E
MARWLIALSWPALKAQWGRQLLALLAIALGVALAFGVQLLNGSALAEFSAAQRSLAGTPDLLLRGSDGRPLDEALLERLMQAPQVQQAAPVIEGQAQVLTEGRFALRLLGLDALQTAQFNPALLPRAFDEGQALQSLLAPDALFLNEAALRRLPSPRPLSVRLRLVGEDGRARDVELRLAGSVAAPGAPLAVLDIAAAQALFGRLGRLDRIELRLQPGVQTQDLTLPEGSVAAAPQDEQDQMARLTRAYRVNLGVLSLMALFTGGFLVFAVISLSVAQRLPQLALLGVLGMSARERMRLVLAEAALLGLLGSGLGLALGAGLAALGLRLLGGDLGSGLLGGPLSGNGPALRLEPWQMLLFGGLGLAVSLLSALLPALAVRRMAVAQVLKGLGTELQTRLPRGLAPALLLAGMLLALLPPFGGVPLAAYLAMLCLLMGGIAAMPGLVRLLTRLLPGRRSAGLMLLRERARDQAGAATQMLAGVLVALALSVAMLVMVHSFRASLQDWLRQMLPADLYLRSSLREAPLAPDFIEAVRASGLAQDLAPQRSRRAWAGDQTELSLLARAIRDENRLPLVGPLAEPPAPDLMPVYINEAMRDQQALRPGARLALSLSPGSAAPPTLQFFVRGVWRDYSRQSGALLMSLADYQRWSGDNRITELSLWLAPGSDPVQAQARLRALAADPADLELAATGELLALSLRLFDRSFAVTYWLQAVALGLGLFGIAASLSAQLLARKREFGLLRHLGFTQAQLQRLLVLETGLFTAAGALAGLALGLGVSAVLVWVVNPQSFHWSMELSLPTARLAALLLAVIAASLLTAWASFAKAGRVDAVQAVREDW